MSPHHQPRRTCRTPAWGPIGARTTEVRPTKAQKQPGCRAHPQPNSAPSPSPPTDGFPSPWSGAFRRVLAPDAGTRDALDPHQRAAWPLPTSRTAPSLCRATPCAAPVEQPPQPPIGVRAGRDTDESVRFMATLPPPHPRTHRPQIELDIVRQVFGLLDRPPFRSTTGITPDGDAKRIDRIPDRLIRKDSMAVPVRVWCSAATLRACSTRAARTETAGGKAGAGTGSGTAAGVLGAPVQGRGSPPGPRCPRTGPEPRSLGRPARSVPSERGACRRGMRPRANPPRGCAARPTRGPGRAVRP